MAKPEKTETKSQRFERLATKRVTAAVKKIRLIAGCSNRNGYEYGKEHVDKIVLELTNAVAFVRDTYRAALEGKAKGEEYTFSFKK